MADWLWFTIEVPWTAVLGVAILRLKFGDLERLFCEFYDGARTGCFRGTLVTAADTGRFGLS